jgi:hypothetical protein
MRIINALGGLSGIHKSLGIVDLNFRNNKANRKLLNKTGSV